MLNYIWAGLIIFSLIFAIGSDLKDEWNNPYQNGVPVKVKVEPPLNADLSTKTPVHLSLSEYQTRIPAVWRPTAKDTELVVSALDDAPELWKTIAQHQRSKNAEQLRPVVLSYDAQTAEAQLILPEIHFIKLRAIASAAFDMAEFAVELAIGLIGGMALWLGLMQIAEQSGLIYSLVRFVEPALHFLFPNVPKGHPALGAISLNLTANMLGLGNAATPLGIKAMEELQKLNPKKDTATDAMCMFLTMNTASVQLVPPVTLVAIMGVSISELIISIFIVTAISLTTGIIAAKLYARSFPESNASQILEEKI